MFQLPNFLVLPLVITGSLALHTGVAVVVAGQRLSSAAVPYPPGNSLLELDTFTPPQPLVMREVPHALVIKAAATQSAHAHRGNHGGQEHVAFAVPGAAPEPEAANQLAAKPTLNAGPVAPPSFVLASNAAWSTHAGVVVPGRAGASISASDETVLEAAVSMPARLLASAPLAYPAQARNAEVEAGVPLELIVDERGHVVDARALDTIGYGLDDAALRAVRSYRFSPALRDGRPVRVRMRWTVVFRLR